MYLSYTGYKAFTSCPRMYWHQYVNKTKLEVPDNRVNSLYGTIVGTLFESFYSDRLWRESGVEKLLLDRVDAHYLQAIRKESRDGAIRWRNEDKKANYTSPEALLEDVRSSIPRGLSIIRHHRLLGPTHSEAEVKLDHGIEGHVIGGRADFIIQRVAPYSDRVIVDGKGSKWRDKYVDPRQLRWYGMLHRLHYGFMPDKLGFVFWRFDPVEAVDWVAFTEEQLLELQASAVSAIRQIDEAKAELRVLPVETDEATRSAALHRLFPVSPGDRCNLCTYRPVCPDGGQFITFRVPIPDGAGVEDVGF